MQYIKSLQDIDHQLYSLFKKFTAFDFVSQVERGTSLFVGEGNLSFAHCIAENVKIPQHIIATTFETEAELSERAVHHKKLLKKRASSVIHGIDALKLHAIFTGLRFETIIFQFPHTGSREPIEGRNPNFILVRGFLMSAKSLLSASGKVVLQPLIVRIIVVL